MGPRAASGPLNGARSATTREELRAPALLLVVPLLLELELQAARPAAASPAAVSRRRRAARSAAAAGRPQRGSV